MYRTPGIALLLIVATLLSSPAGAQAPSAALPDFRSIVQRYGPAVVNIRTIQTLRLTINAPDAGGGEAGLPQGQGARRDPDSASRSKILRGIGSGFFVRPDGVILTNAHVVANSSDVVVSLTDEREFAGRVLGIDPASDVAVVKIDGHNMPTVPIGKPTEAQPGDWVLAIGAPFGFENSVTAGIVSAKGRSLSNGSGVPFIQTDVPINPGNSGGPLFNLAGQVIGINSQIYSNSGAFQGMSFSIPIDVAMKIAEQLMATGKVVRGHLGVTSQELTPALAAAFGLPAARGALINEVEADSPAQRAGLMAGDVVVAINGSAIVYGFDLQQRVSDIAPGGRATLDLVRDRKPLRTMAILEAASDDTEESDLRGAERLTFGLTVRPLTPTERMRAGLGGLVVVETSGNAVKAGFEVGDVVLAVNGRPVGDARQLRESIGSAARVAVLVQREEGRLYLALSTAGR